VSYGPDFIDHHRRAASYVDKILRCQARDLPVEQPTPFELVINSRPPWPSHQSCCKLPRFDLFADSLQGVSRLEGARRPGRTSGLFPISAS